MNYLKISEAIKKDNIGNEYNIGIKSFHDLFPSKVNEKIIADTKLKIWDEKHKQSIAEQSRRISEFESANSSRM